MPLLHANEANTHSQQPAASSTRSRQAQRPQRNGMNAFGSCVPLWLHGKNRRVVMFVLVVVAVMILNLKQGIQLLEQVIHKREAWFFLGIDNSSSTTNDNDDGNFTYWTEPDTILGVHTNPDALVALSQQILEDKVWASHPFQPQPHEEIETVLTMNPNSKQSTIFHSHLLGGIRIVFPPVGGKAKIDS